MKIVVVGSGYVGLVSGACFADLGNTVTCVDKDAAKIDRLEAGEIPIYEPGLEELVRKNVAAGRLSFSTSLAGSLQGVDAVFIAVGTPCRESDGHADLSFVHAAAREIAENLSGPTVVVTKSTVPVGTGDAIEAIFRERPETPAVSVVSNPEFLREGCAIHDFNQPDRIVVGANDDLGRKVMERLYKPLHTNDGPLLITNRRTAELIKYASNAFLATKIAFINEVADLCEKVGADVQDVSRGMGLDRRIGPKFLDAGPGYGGSCFPKDTVALARAAEGVGTRMQIVETVIASNAERKREMGKRIVAALEAAGGSSSGKRVALLGLTFKPDTDDMRESPSIDIVAALKAGGCTVSAYDPAGAQEAHKHFGDTIAYFNDPYEACRGADAVALITEWGEFRNLDFAPLRALVAQPLFFDFRNVFDPKAAQQAGFVYHSIGRP